MKVKNLVLFGFVLSALSYLNDQAKDENNNDFDFLRSAENSATDSKMSSVNSAMSFPRSSRSVLKLLTVICRTMTATAKRH